MNRTRTLRSGALGEVTLVTSRAFMNRLVAVDNYKRTDDPKSISPMVISGTHALDIVMWMMECKTPVELWARSTDKALGALCKGTDATVGTMVFSDGTLYNSVVSWALPVSWPGAVYGLELGIVGADGVLTIDDTHRDIVLAVSRPQGFGYVSDDSRLVDFVGSAPPGVTSQTVPPQQCAVRKSTRSAVRAKLARYRRCRPCAS